MESHLLVRQQSLLEKIPEMQKSLDCLDMLDQERLVDVEINDSLYVQTLLKPTEKVNLWLGANVMLEYPIQEAQDLLKEKLKSGQETLSQVKEDLEYLKEQITTMEVNMARVYNDEVKNRTVVVDTENP